MHTIVIGAGQAGLSASYCLSRQGIDHKVLEKNQRVGDQWRKRWDSLKLFTPAKYNAIPGKAFPAKKWSFPGKEQVAQYFEEYAQEFDLPVECGVMVESLDKDGDEFVVKTNRDDWGAKNVIVATGAFQKPYVPACSSSIKEDVLQLHSSQYRNPSQLRPGSAMVVGTGNSGVQISEELSKTHDVTLAGRENGGVPRSLLGLDIYWWLKNLGLFNASIHSPVIKRMKKKMWGKGDPLVGRKMSDIEEKFGVRRAAKVRTAQNGSLVMEDGQEIPIPDNIIWATGFRPDFSWINFDIFEEDGYPRHERGVVAEVPGLYFIGLKLLYRLSSSLLGGVGKDAKYLADQIAKN